MALQRDKPRLVRNMVWALLAVASVTVFSSTYVWRERREEGGQGRAAANGRSIEASGFREVGFSGSLAFDPSPSSDRGLSLSLSQTLGASATGGVDALYGRATMAGLGGAAAAGAGGSRTRSRWQPRTCSTRTCSICAGIIPSWTATSEWRSPRVFLSENGLLPSEALDADAWDRLTLDVAASRLDRIETAGRLRTLLLQTRYPTSYQPSSFQVPWPISLALLTALSDDTDIDIA